MIEELDDLEGRGHVTAGLVFVSGNAHLIMPWHVALDGARERKLGNLQIGTTRRGIGPAYADKATRIGIRVQDLLDPKILHQKIELAITEKNVWLERVYEIEPFDLEEVAHTYEGYAQRLRPYVADTSLLVDRALRNGDNVLFEGAQGTLLDLDHGTYPFVTSSSPIAAGAAVSFGIGPNRIDEILGVSKAYVTRVGEGPFPSEIEGNAQELVRELGGEFGTVTGRERRCGWLDLPALRFAVRVNGITSLALTKLDVLSTFAEIPICVRYALPDRSETDDFPAHQSDFHHCRPVWETLPGWQRGARRHRAPGGCRCVRAVRRGSPRRSRLARRHRAGPRGRADVPLSFASEYAQPCSEQARGPRRRARQRGRADPAARSTYAAATASSTPLGTGTTQALVADFSARDRLEAARLQCEAEIHRLDGVAERPGPREVDHVPARQDMDTAPVLEPERLDAVGRGSDLGALRDRRRRRSPTGGAPR